MLDPKKLLDALIAASSEVTAPVRDPNHRQQDSEIGDLLGRSNVGRSADIGPAGDGGRSSGSGGGLGDILGDILGQARDGAADGARRIEESTGAGARLDDILRRSSGGQSAGDLLTRAKDLIRDNPGAAGAIAAALGGLLLGTKTGRSLTVNAAKLGGLVLIGGLAYKAYKNYRDGQPPLDSGQAADDIEAAPSGTGFEAGAQTNGDALLYVRSMIAAAISDGQIDRAERAKILGGIREAGLESESADFLEAEFDYPATVQDLIDETTTPQGALQVYTAARLAIEPDTHDEREFLAALAHGLQLDRDLVAHVDSEVGSIKV